jgi:hypothetical protein
METPFTGRAIINDIYNGIEVIIPARRNWLAIVQAVFALFFCTVGIIVVPLQILNDPNPNTPRGVAVVFVLVPALLGFFACSALWWAFSGREVVTVEEGVLSIERKNSMLKTKTYRLAEAANFRAAEDPWDYGYMAVRRAQLMPWIIKKTGTVKFDYGLGTIRFGDRLSEAEGNYIIQRLKDKRRIN